MAAYSLNQRGIQWSWNAFTFVYHIFCIQFAIHTAIHTTLKQYMFQTIWYTLHVFKQYNILLQSCLKCRVFSLVSFPSILPLASKGPLIAHYLGEGSRTHCTQWCKTWSTAACSCDTCFHIPLQVLVVLGCMPERNCMACSQERVPVVEYKKHVSHEHVRSCIIGCSECVTRHQVNGLLELRLKWTTSVKRLQYEHSLVYL